MELKDVDLVANNRLQAFWLTLFGVLLFFVGLGFVIVATVFLGQAREDILSIGGAILLVGTVGAFVAGLFLWTLAAIVLREMIPPLIRGVP